MNSVHEYLSCLRELYPMPKWMNGASALAPDKLPTPFNVDGIVGGAALVEWRIVRDPLARSVHGESGQPRSFRVEERVSELANSGRLDHIGFRVEALTVGADQEAFLSIRDERLLASPPWADGTKFNVDVVRIADLILKGAPTFLTGPLGSGKSTYCRWLANTLATQRLRDSDSLLPIFLDLRIVASRLSAPQDEHGTLTILDLTRAVLASLGLPPDGAEDLANAWRGGRACLLVDGFDELGVVLNQRSAGPLESALARTLASLAEESPNILVSSRPGVLIADQFDPFLEVEFAPLTLAESVTILREFSKLPPENLVTVAVAIPPNLRARPLFLSLVGRLFAQKAVPALDGLTRWTLLDASLRLLLDERLVDKDPRSNVAEILGCEYESLTAVLQAVAFEAELASPDVGAALSIPRARLTELLLETDVDTDITKVLKVLTREAGLMVSREKDLEFSHRSFQDFLTAGHLARLSTGDRNHTSLLDSLKKAPHAIRDAAELYVERLGSDPNHRDNDLLDLCWAALESADAAEYSEYGGTCIWLAAVSLRNVGQISERDFLVRDTFVFRAERYVGDATLLSAPDRILIADQLGRWGDLREGVGVDDNGVPKHVWVSITSGHAAVGLNIHRQRRLQDVGIENFRREIPEAEVSLEEFGISLYPTTWSQFRAFLNAPDGFRDARWWSAWGHGDTDWGGEGRLTELLAEDARGNEPAVGVDWYEAMGYCRWLGERLGAAIDLPREEEWEVAARGQFGEIFPWGEEFDAALSNWAGTGMGRVVSVGCFKDGSGPLRPLDMIGNVWEWTRSIAGDAGAEGFTEIGFAGFDLAPIPDVRRVVRGGSYLNEAPLLRATYRGNDVATARFDRQGFRVVKRDQGRGAFE
jgi:formylglycine-generating enzyme required for sulfatase activity